MNFAQSSSDQEVIDGLFNAIHKARLLVAERTSRLGDPQEMKVVRLREFICVLDGAHGDKPFLSVWEPPTDTDVMIRCAWIATQAARLKAWERREKSLTFKQRVYRMLGLSVFPAPQIYTAVTHVYKISLKKSE